MIFGIEVNVGDLTLLWSGSIVIEKDKTVELQFPNEGLKLDLSFVEQEVKEKEEIRPIRADLIAKNHLKLELVNFRPTRRSATALRSSSAWNREAPWRDANETPPKSSAR